MKHTHRPSAPGPSVQVPCPWCGAPVALEPDAAVLECGACLVTVELSGSVTPARARRLTRAA